MANFFKASDKKPTKTIIKSNLMIDIDKLDMNGCGVGRYQNKPVFIDGCLPQENVEIRLVEQKNKYSLGKLINVNVASSNRVKVSCQHFELCGGCDLQHLEYKEQLVFKQKKVTELFSRSGLDKAAISQLPWQEPIASKPWHYRRKARIGVQFDKKSQAIIGFRKKASNQLVPIKSCPTLVKPLSDVFPILRVLIAKLSVKKAIGHIEVMSTKGQSDEQILTLVIRQIRTLNQLDRELWKTYAKQHHWQVVFDLGNGKSENLNTHQTLTYSLGNTSTSDINITFANDDFIQVNQAANEAMVKQAIEWLELKSSDQLLDLFCGLGNFSLPIARIIDKVVGIEGVQTMVDKAKINAKDNRLSNCHFYQADLNNTWLEKDWVKGCFTKVLLDPARAGAEQAVSQLVKLAIGTILYVSCDPATLARDSQLLLSQGYKIVKIGLIDMFSQTKHVETMVLFSK